MSKSGVYEVYNKTATVARALADSARDAVAKACLDTEARAKLEITRQGAIDTGAARASIYARTPQRNKHGSAMSAAKGKNPKAQLFPDYQIHSTHSTPEGIVAVGVLYGYYIEFGSVRRRVSIPPRPFMTPAVEAVAPGFEKHCLDFLKAQLR